jgi:hypothetical protein
MKRRLCLCLKKMERVKGIEPSYEAWEAAVLPLNYTRMQAIVSVVCGTGLAISKASCSAENRHHKSAHAPP